MSAGKESRGPRLLVAGLEGVNDNNDHISITINIMLITYQL